MVVEVLEILPKSGVAFQLVDRVPLCLVGTVRR